MDERAASVYVPPTDVPLTPCEFDSLRTLVCPLDECDDMGVGFYATTKNFVNFCQNQ